MILEYGAMSSKYSVEAEDKLTCYAAAILHFGGSAGVIAIYAPEECREDSWLFAHPIEQRLDEVFGGGERAFLNYLDEHKEEIRAACKTIKQLFEI